MKLETKNISVIGMGKTGIAAANFLARRGAKVCLMDIREQAPELESGSLDPAVQVRLGTNRPGEEAELVIVSPGIDINAHVLEESIRRGVEVIGEIELAGRLTDAPIVAVTGTNGKSTTTTLIGDMLRRGGKHTQVAGNIGVPFISLIDAPAPDFFALEISSFQLETIRDFKPHIAVILNVTPDHLDRHGTIEQYADLKANLARNQGAENFLILNFDDPRVASMGRNRRAQLFHFSLTSPLENGAYVDRGEIVFKRDGTESRICAVSDLHPAMQLQIENVLAAVVAGVLAEVDPQSIAETLKTFKGLEHRLEWVRAIDGVDFVNDSKSTNVGSLLKSLNSFERPIVLIAGGRDKDGDYLPLKEPMKKRVKHLILMGEAKDLFLPLINGTFTGQEVDSLEEAVNSAAAKAEPGDVVLLSPACSSFDMFSNYEDRGRRFKAFVNGL